ncbi:MAG: calcium-binding protein [Actinobacteria bacterium]|nr:MAG: calcium-binding protein [Actinomycetota bacterium]
MPLNLLHGSVGLRTLGVVAATVACLVLTGAAQVGASSCAGRTPTIVGTPGSDDITGTDGPDVIVGLGGNDTIHGLGGDDEICTGDGNDTIYGGDGNDGVFAGGGNDAIYGEAGTDALFGDSGNDTIDAGTGPFDGVNGGPGDDTMTGSGFDLVTFLDAANGVRVDFRSGTATGEGHDTFTGFLAASGSNYNDALIGDGQGNDFFPLGGNDVVRGNGGFDTVLFVSTVNVDLAKRHASGEGSDTLLSIEGVGTNKGNDVLAGDAGGNFLWGNVGNDRLLGRGGNDRLVGDEGNDVLEGGGGNDTLWGGAGNDSLIGGAGTNDEVDFFTSESGVSVDLAAGTSSGDGNDVVRGVESVSGTEFDDRLAGTPRSNSLYGEGGNDALAGGGGNDFLNGGSGTDSLDGGTGSDYCIDGETLSACESSGTSAFRFVRGHGKGTTYGGDGSSGEDVSRLTAIARLLQSFTRAEVGQVLPSELVRWHSEPTCRSARGRNVTSIAPPSFVEPRSNMQVRWQGSLYRVGGGRTTKPAAPAEAQVVGLDIATPGYPNSWHYAGKRTKNYLRITRTVPAGRYYWQSTVLWEQTGDTLTGRVEPNHQPPSAAGGSDSCSFRRR